MIEIHMNKIYVFSLLQFKDGRVDLETIQIIIFYDESLNGFSN